MTRAEKIQNKLLERLGSPEAVHAWRQEMGRKGGEKSRGGGFGSKKVGYDGLTGRERAMLAGARGGAAGKRGKNV